MNKGTKQEEEQTLASLWQHRFKKAMIHKMPYVKKWQDYWDAYNGDYFKNKKQPDYKSDLASNYVFSTVETIRPLMLDNNPTFETIPRTPEGMGFSHDLQQVLSYEWDREGANLKLYKDLITLLVTGNTVYFVPWNKQEKNTKLVTVNPLNLFPDPLATCVDDAEYLIYASYKNVERLKRRFPKRAKELTGSSVNYSELVHENDHNASVDNQVLVLEVWTRNYEEEANEKTNYNKENEYPNGRVITMCPELGIVLKDVENPYQDGEFPFVVLKDYDVPGKFWGEGEVAQLLSPQKHMNELNNAIIDNAKTTANMPWIVDKNAGIGYGKITGRPGLVIRKNPGSEVRREVPPNMPLYVINAVETFKQDMEQISGIFNTVKGNSETGVYTAQGVLALQEAGQLRVRIKVKVMEEGLAKVARLFYSRMKQFWQEDRWLMIVKDEGKQDMKKFTRRVLEHEFDIHVSAGSTMPVNKSAMLDLMIRLAQTPMPDGQNLVDREAVVEYLPPEIRATMLERMEEKDVSMQQMQEELQMAVQGMQEMAQQLEQQLEELRKESEANDDQHIQMIEEIAKALEELQERIIQTQGAHDTLENEKKEQDKIDKVKKEAYNRGYSDSESTIQEEMGDPDVEGLEGAMGLEDQTGVPTDLLDLVESMSEEELAQFIEEFPELAPILSGDTQGMEGGTTPVL